MTAPTLSPLPRLLIEPIVRAALLEDLGRAGDVTTDAVVPADARFSAVIASRQTGVIAGVDAAEIAFHLIDPTLEVTLERLDGTHVTAGDVVLRLEGSARAILTAERVALNLACRLSGVATATHALVEVARVHGKAHVVCTRKTTPGLRALEKHAVKAGGGSNHRFGLDDAVLIKDNHIAVAGGVATAIARAKAGAGHMVKIEVEVDTLEQLEEAMAVGIDAVLLDNMDPDTLRRAVDMVGGRALTEASGRINRETIGAVAASGVDLISVGWITHSAPILDLGLDAVKSL
jgi:nicotinate-nucleotide pyrophosphorylase (carboxylating)